MIVFACLFIVSSCIIPTSKESYLRKFENFVEKVGKEHGKYKKSDWNYTDRVFKKFSKDWYKEYKDELTTQEQLKVAELKVRYNSYKGVNKLEQFYDEVLKEDAGKIKEKVKYYLDNNMDEDLEKLKEGAKEISDSLLNVVEEIIDDADRKF